MIFSFRACLHEGGGPQVGDQHVVGHPNYHVNVITLKWEIILAGGLPDLSGLPHLSGVPNLQVNRPLVFIHVQSILSLPTPLYYGQFIWYQKCQTSYIPYLYHTDTAVKRTIGSVPLVSVLKRFDCIYLRSKMSLLIWLFVIIIKSTRWSANLSPAQSYFSFGIICGRLWGSFAVEHHLQSQDHFRLGIICGTVQHSSLKLMVLHYQEK